MADELRRYAEEGGNVLLFPSPDANREGLRTLMRALPAHAPLRLPNSTQHSRPLNLCSFVCSKVV